MALSGTFRHLWKPPMSQPCLCRVNLNLVFSSGLFRLSLWWICPGAPGAGWFLRSLPTQAECGTFHERSVCQALRVQGVQLVLWKAENAHQQHQQLWENPKNTPGRDIKQRHVNPKSHLLLFLTVPAQNLFSRREYLSDSQRNPTVFCNYFVCKCLGWDSQH